MTPTNITTAIISGGVRISWTDTSLDEHGYEVWGSINDGEYTLLGTTLPNITSYDDMRSGGTINMKYKVRSKQSTTRSKFSNIKSPELLEFNFESSGNGSGVGQMNLLVSETVSMSIDGTGRFYTNAEGTTGESTTVSIATGALRRVYIKVPSGTSTVRIKNVITSFGQLVGGSYAGGRGWETIGDTDSPCLITDLSKLTNATSIIIFGHNRTYGDLSDLDLLVLELACNSAIHTTATYGSICTGDVSQWANLVMFDPWDLTHFTGSFNNLQDLEVIWVGGLSSCILDISTIPKLKTCIISSTNTIYPSGSIADKTTLNNLQVYQNTLSGSIVGCTNLGFVSIGHNSGSITFPEITNLTKLSFLYIPYTVLSEANTNQILADLWANKDVAKTYSLRSITLNGTPTGQGLTDKAALQAYRSPNNDAQYSLWTINTN